MLREQQRPATPDEQAVLARWSSWGAAGVKQVFDDHLPDQAKARATLRDLLSDREYLAARRTVLNAHYTDAALATVMWDALGQLGFTGGDVLEPSCGSGNFIGVAPENVQITGVELDPTSAGIAAALYPQARIVQGSFAKITTPEASFDATVGNVPFARLALTDERHNPGRKHSIHNHFILKALHLTRPGGIVALLTSRHTMDAQNPAARREMAALADLVGAVRLPSGAHRRAAGTEVVTDLLVLRRRAAGEQPHEDEPWERALPHKVEAGHEPATLTINEYFLDHPEYVLGEFAVTRSQYDRHDLDVRGPQDVADALATAVRRITTAATEVRGLAMTERSTTATGPRPAVEVSMIDPHAAQYEGFLQALPDGTFTRRVGGVDEPYHPSASEAGELRSLLEMRDLAMSLIRAEEASVDDTPQMADLRARINRVYDAYVTEFGPVKRFSERRQMRQGWHVFGEWCEEQGRPKLPTSAETVTAYLERLRDMGCDKTLLQRHLDSIAAEHDRAQVRQIARTIKELRQELTKDGLDDDEVDDRAAHAQQVADSDVSAFVAAYHAEDVRLPPDVLPAAAVVLNSAEHATDPDLDLDEARLRTTVVVRPRQGGFRDDPHAGYVRGLEKFDPTTHTAQKATIFTQRVVNPPPRRLGADTPEEALTICLDTHSRVVLDEIARLLGLPDGAAAREALGELVYDDPATGTVLWAREYLSGNVRHKLAIAEAAAEQDSRYAVNVAALQAVIPPDLGPAQIEVRLGAWVGPSDVQAFARELLGDPKVTVERPATGLWHVDNGTASHVIAHQRWGTEDRSAYDLLQDLLLGKEIRVMREKQVKLPSGSTSTRRVLDLAATEAAKDKAEQISDHFTEWVWKDPERAERLARYYNNRFNAEIPRDYSGIELALPGYSHALPLREHQNNAIAAMIYESAIGIIHDVGAGKTLEIIIGVMERRRRGLSTKPMIVVPNDSIADQFETEWRRAYPNARLLVATSDEVSTPNDTTKSQNRRPKSRDRKKRTDFIAKVAANDWDAVILTKEAFEKIPVRPERQEAFLAQEVDELRKIQDNRRVREAMTESMVARFELALANAEERLDKRLADIDRDQGMTFEDTGVDYIVVDEAHNYKNGLVITNLPGMAIAGSNRAIDLDMKLAYFVERFGKPQVCLATATPFTNSPSEVFLVQRRLGYDVDDFDTWARTFYVMADFMEMLPGGALALKSRMRGTINETDLYHALRVRLDIKMKEDLGLTLPTLRDGKIEILDVPAVPELQMLAMDLVRRQQVLPTRPKKGDDTHLKVLGDGIKGALDVRTMGLSTTHPQKVDVLADDIMLELAAAQDNVYHRADGSEHPVRGGLILVFCDLSVPSRKWNFYRQLKDNLIARGLPEDKVRFIQEANSPSKRADLLAACREGGVSVLIGSTMRMGFGLNVQDRAIGGYEVTVPWRADISHQAQGRVERQGNQNATFFWKKSVTFPSLDAKKAEIVKQKHDMFSPLLSSTPPARTREVNDSESIGFADLMAAATGDQRYIEKFQLDQDYDKLRRRRKAWVREQQDLKFVISNNLRRIEQREQAVTAWETLTGKVTPTDGDAFRMTVDGTVHTERVPAANALRLRLLAQMSSMDKANRATITVGSLAGLKITATLSPYRDLSIQLDFEDAPDNRLCVELDHRDLPGGYGIVTRLENAARSVANVADLERAEIKALRQEIADAQPAVEQRFAHAEDLARVSRRREQLIAELSDTQTTEGDKEQAAEREAQRIQVRAQVMAGVGDAARGDEAGRFADWYADTFHHMPESDRPTIPDALRVWRELPVSSAAPREESDGGQQETPPADIATQQTTSNNQPSPPPAIPSGDADPHDHHLQRPEPHGSVPQGQDPAPPSTSSSDPPSGYVHTYDPIAVHEAELDLAEAVSLMPDDDPRRRQAVELLSEARLLIRLADASNGQPMSQATFVRTGREFDGLNDVAEAMAEQARRAFERNTGRNTEHLLWHGLHLEFTRQPDDTMVASLSVPGDHSYPHPGSYLDIPVVLGSGHELEHTVTTVLRQFVPTAAATRARLKRLLTTTPSTATQISSPPAEHDEPRSEQAEAAQPTTAATVAAPADEAHSQTPESVQRDDDLTVEPIPAAPPTAPEVSTSPSPGAADPTQQAQTSGTIEENPAPQDPAVSDELDQKLRAAYAEMLVELAAASYTHRRSDTVAEHGADHNNRTVTTDPHLALTQEMTALADLVDAVRIHRHQLDEQAHRLYADAMNAELDPAVATRAKQLLDRAGELDALARRTATAKPSEQSFVIPRERGFMARQLNDGDLGPTLLGFCRAARHGVRPEEVLSGLIPADYLTWRGAKIWFETGDTGVRIQLASVVDSGSDTIAVPEDWLRRDDAGPLLVDAVTDAVASAARRADEMRLELGALLAAENGEEIREDASQRAANTSPADAASEVVDDYGVTSEHPVVGYVRESVARLPLDPNPERAVADRYRVAAEAIDLYVVTPEGVGVSTLLRTIGARDGAAESVIPRWLELRPAVEWPHWIRSLHQSTTILRAAGGLDEFADRVVGVADLLARRMDTLATTPAAFQVQSGSAGVRLLPVDHPAAPSLARQLDRALNSRRVTGERHDTRGPLKLAIEVLDEPGLSADELAERACYGTSHSLLRWWPTVAELRDLADVADTAGYTTPLPGREVSAPELWRAVADGVAARLTDRPRHEPEVPVEVPAMVPIHPRKLYEGEKTTPVDRLLDEITNGTAHSEDAEATRMAAKTTTDVATAMLGDLDAADPDRVRRAAVALQQGAHDEALLHLSWALDGRHPLIRRGVREAWDVLYQLLWPEPGWDLERVARRMITWADHDPAQLSGALVALAAAWRTRSTTGDDLARLLAEPPIATVADQLGTVAGHLATRGNFTLPSAPRIRPEQASLFDLGPDPTERQTKKKTGKKTTRTTPRSTPTTANNPSTSPDRAEARADQAVATEVPNTTADRPRHTEPQQPDPPPTSPAGTDTAPLQPTTGPGPAVEVARERGAEVFEAAVAEAHQALADTAAAGGHKPEAWLRFSELTRTDPASGIDYSATQPEYQAVSQWWIQQATTALGELGYRVESRRAAGRRKYREHQIEVDHAAKLVIVDAVQPAGTNAFNLVQQVAALRAEAPDTAGQEQTAALDSPAHSVTEAGAHSEDSATPAPTSETLDATRESASRAATLQSETAGPQGDSGPARAPTPGPDPSTDPPTEPGVWSERIRVDLSPTDLIVSGTDRGRDPDIIRATLKDNNFWWQKPVWRYKGRVSGRNKAAQEIRDLLSELDAQERAASAAPSHPPTPQQQDIKNAVAASHDVAVFALAGTGKTTTLRMLAHALPDLRIVYIAFNRSIADEAQASFPRHVVANTMHSFAKQTLQGGPHEALLDKLDKGLRLPKDIAPILGITAPIRVGETEYSPEAQARLAMSTVAQFRNSSADNIEAAHLPAATAESQALSRMVLDHANQMWADILSPTGRIVFTHDDYLKIWALTKPRFNADVIFFDEAQDINDVQKQVILDHRTARDGHRAAQIIVVGDSYQSIYGFRGAKDALRSWPVDVRLPLTQSWRFGPAIADLGNRFLALLRASMRLEGNSALDTRLALVPQPDAVLCRTNAGAVTAVFDAHEAGQRVALVGGGGAIRDIAKAAVQLQRGRRTRHPELSGFADWSEVREAASNEQAVKHLQPFVRLVDRHGAHTLIDMADALVSETDPNPDTGPQIVVSTVHKAKGREWDEVRIAGDFRGPTVDDDGNTVLPGAEELRLSYVTVTRAKQALELGSLSWILDYPSSQAASGPQHAHASLRADQAVDEALVDAESDLSPTTLHNLADTDQPVAGSAPGPADDQSTVRQPASDTQQTPVHAQHDDQTGRLTVPAGRSASPDRSEPDSAAALSAREHANDATSGRGGNDATDTVEPADTAGTAQSSTVDSADLSIDELDAAEGFSLIEDLAGVSELFRTQYWKLVEVQAVDDVGTYTDHWRRRNVSVAVSLTPDDRVLTRLFIRRGPWDSDAWHEIETDSAQFVRELAEQAGLHGVARPARLPGRWRVEDFAFAADAVTERADNPAWRLVTRPADGANEVGNETDEASWVFADDGRPVPLAPPLPQVAVSNRNDLIKYVLGDRHRDKQLRRMAQVVLSGRTNDGLNVGDAQRQLAAEEPEIYRRALTAAVGRPRKRGEQFDVGRAQQALERLAEGDPALPLNSVGQYIEITEPDLEAEEVPLVGPMPTRTVRGVVVEVTPEPVNQLRVVIERDVTSVTGAPRAVQDVPADAVLTWLDPAERPSAEELRAARDAMAPAIREHQQQLGIDTITGTTADLDGDAAVQTRPETSLRSAPEPLATTGITPDVSAPTNSAATLDHDVAVPGRAASATTQATMAANPAPQDGAHRTEHGTDDVESAGRSDSSDGVAGDMAAAALAWWDAGCSVVRVETDGSKRPLPHRWAQFREQRASREQVTRWFANGHPGVGVVCGTVSGDLEMFELEGRAVDEHVVEALRERMSATGHGELWNRLNRGYLERSPSGGIHLLYRVEGGVDRNTKLAQREARDDELTDQERDLLRETGKRARRVLIETRGEGGFVVVAPSHASVHDSGNPWQVLAGAPATIPTITAAERDVVHMAARDLDQIPAPSPVPDPAPRTAHDADGLRPGDDFNQRATWHQVLEPHGWVAVGGDTTRTYWRRPGKDRGISAVSGGDRGDYLWVFSTSTNLPSEQALSKWRTYGLLDHAGDFSATARALSAAGYGNRVHHSLASPQPPSPRNARFTRTGTTRGRQPGGAPSKTDNEQPNTDTTPPSTPDPKRQRAADPPPRPLVRDPLIPQLLNSAAPPRPEDAATATGREDIRNLADVSQLLRAQENRHQTGWITLTRLADRSSHELHVAAQSLAQVRDAARRLWPVAVSYGLGLDAALDLDTMSDAAGTGVVVHLPRADTLDRDATAVVAALEGYRGRPGAITGTTTIAGPVSHRNASTPEPATHPARGTTPDVDRALGQKPAARSNPTNGVDGADRGPLTAARERVARMLDRVAPAAIRTATQLLSAPGHRERAMQEIWRSMPIVDARLTSPVIQIVRDVVYGVTWHEHIDTDHRARTAIADGHGLPTATIVAAVADELGRRSRAEDPLAAILRQTDTEEIVTQLHDIADGMAVHGEFVVPGRPNLLTHQQSLFDMPGAADTNAAEQPSAARHQQPVPASRRHENVPDDTSEAGGTSDAEATPTDIPEAGTEAAKTDEPESDVDHRITTPRPRSVARHAHEDDPKRAGEDHRRATAPPSDTNISKPDTPQHESTAATTASDPRTNGQPTDSADTPELGSPEEHVTFPDTTAPQPGSVEIGLSPTVVALRHHLTASGAGWPSRLESFLTATDPFRAQDELREITRATNADPHIQALVAIAWRAQHGQATVDQVTAFADRLTAADSSLVGNAAGRTIRDPRTRQLRDVREIRADIEGQVQLRTTLTKNQAAASTPVDPDAWLDPHGPEVLPAIEAFALLDQWTQLCDQASAHGYTVRQQPNTNVVLHDERHIVVDADTLAARVASLADLTKQVTDRQADTPTVEPANNSPTTLDHTAPVDQQSPLPGTSDQESAPAPRSRTSTNAATLPNRVSEHRDAIDRVSLVAANDPAAEPLAEQLAMSRHTGVLRIDEPGRLAMSYVHRVLRGPAEDAAFLAQTVINVGHRGEAEQVAARLTKLANKIDAAGFTTPIAGSDTPIAVHLRDVANHVRARLTSHATPHPAAISHQAPAESPPATTPAQVSAPEDPNTSPTPSAIGELNDQSRQDNVPQPDVPASPSWTVAAEPSESVTLRAGSPTDRTPERHEGHTHRDTHASGLRALHTKRAEDTPEVNHTIHANSRTHGIAWPTTDPDIESPEQLTAQPSTAPPSGAQPASAPAPGDPEPATNNDRRNVLSVGNNDLVTALPDDGTTAQWVRLVDQASRAGYSVATVYDATSDVEEGNRIIRIRGDQDAVARVVDLAHKLGQVDATGNRTESSTTPTHGRAQAPPDHQPASMAGRPPSPTSRPAVAFEWAEPQHPLPPSMTPVFDALVRELGWQDTATPHGEGIQPRAVAFQLSEPQPLPPGVTPVFEALMHELGWQDHYGDVRDDKLSATLSGQPAHHRPPATARRPRPSNESTVAGMSPGRRPYAGVGLGRETVGTRGRNGR